MKTRALMAAAVSVSCLVSAAAIQQGAAAQQALNVEFILDASGSMTEQIEGRSKMEIAKEVLQGLLREMPPSARVAVRAYGHRRKGDCNDLELLAPFGPNPSARVKGKLRDLRAMGMTPIAGALEAAGKDFASLKGQQNIILLVSDGKETCGKDPCAVARRLQKSGTRVEVNVIGFDVKAEERKQLACIAQAGGGKYYNASNAKEFRLAAAEVKRRVKAAPKMAVFFRDDFKGEDPNPAWKVQKEDEDRWVQEDGKLVIVTQAGDVAGKRDDLKNQIFLDRKLPKNYTLNVKMSIPLTSRGNWGGFLIQRNKDNYLKVAYWAKPWGNNLWRKAIFVKEIRGKVNHLEFGPTEIGGKGGVPKVKLIGPRKDPETVWLRLKRKGRTFSASFSTDGKTWHRIGDHTMLRMSKARLSLAAANDRQGAAEVAAEFDVVEVLTEQP